MNGAAVIDRANILESWARRVCMVDLCVRRGSASCGTAILGAAVEQSAGGGR